LGGCDDELDKNENLRFPAQAERNGGIVMVAGLSHIETSRIFVEPRPILLRFTEVQNDGLPKSGEHFASQAFEMCFSLVCCWARPDCHASLEKRSARDGFEQ
jgi:hypothetical protein